MTTVLFPATEKDKVFSIIGGGSTGPVILIELAKQIREQNIRLDGYKFNLIDPKGFCNGGIAYGQASDNHYLNSTRDEISPWNPLAFHRHAQENGLGSLIKTFDKRKGCVPFLKKEYTAALEFLKSRGVSFAEHVTSAEDIEINKDGSITILDAEKNPIGDTVNARNIIFSLGYSENNNFPALQNYKGEGYVHSLYPPQELNIALQKQPRRIAILGAGAALQDCANDIKAHGIEVAALYNFSNAGKPLGIRDTALEIDEQNYTPQYLGRLNGDTDLQTLKQTVKAEFAAANIQGFPLRRVSLDIMRALRPVMLRIDPTVAQAYTRAGELQQISHDATPVPLFSDQTLRAFNPAFFKQRLGERDIQKARDGTFTIQTEKGPVEVDLIINATGHGKYGHPILQKMLAKGQISINPNIDAVRTDETGYRLPGLGSVIIGPAMHFGVHGIESFYAYTQPMVQELIAEHLQNRSITAQAQQQAVNARALIPVSL